MAQSVKFQLRRDVAANWAGNNPILAPGEPGFATPDGTTAGNRLKIGTGLTGWNSLPYVDCGTTGPTGALGQGSWTPVISDPTQIVQSTTVPGTFTKIGASGAGAYISSAQSYSSGCYASLTVGTTGETWLGLSTSGTVGSTIISYEIAIKLDSIPTTPPTRRVMLRANGAYLGDTGGFGTFTSGDNFAIQYDGTFIKFYKNGVQIGPTVQRGNTFTGSLYLFALQIEQGSIIQNLLLLPLAPGPTGPAGPPGTGGGGTGVAQSSWNPVAVPPTNVRIGPTGGTFAKINGLVSGYDTAIRSAQSYLSGCYISFNSPSVAGSEAIMGISSTPNPVGNTGIAATDIQYGINYNQSGTTYRFYESSDTFVVGSCQPGDSFSIVYDGTNVNYYQQNLLVRSVIRNPGQTGAFHLEGNFQNYGSVDNLVFGPLVSKAGQGGWTPTLYQMVQSSTPGTFNSTQPQLGWIPPNTAQMSSIQGFRQAYSSFSLNLSSNPPPSSYMGLSISGSFAPINPPPPGLWGICVTASPATVQIYENALSPIFDASTIPGVLPILSSDVFTTYYDGVNFTYYKNAIVLKQTSYMLAAGSLLYLSSQHSQQNSSFTNVVFGPVNASSALAVPLFIPSLPFTTPGSGGAYLLLSTFQYNPFISLGHTYMMIWNDGAGVNGQITFSVVSSGVASPPTYFGPIQGSTTFNEAGVTAVTYNGTGSVELGAIITGKTVASTGSAIIYLMS